jgi:AcrR family transcriptional regulator
MPRIPRGSAARTATVKKADAPRERLLRAADELFYRRGIRNVGIDEIIAEAGVAKASLYKHFESKDDLVAEYVRQRDTRWREWFQREVEDRASTPRDRLLAVFDVLGEWLASPGFRGCAFQNATIELADAKHAGHAAAVANKRAVRAFLRDLAREAGVADPGPLADQLSLLAEGAIVTALMERTPTAARTARRAAAQLLKAAGGAT